MSRREYAISAISPKDLGEFTVDAQSHKVAFASGNLQYRASDELWRFAEHQYDVIRAGVGNNTPLPQRETQSDWIDLFNYGCTGYDNGQTAYQPWTLNTDRYAFYDGNTAGTTADFSYPYNVQEGTNFRTLTDAEWSYVAFTRSGERFAKATVHGIEGLILIPDGETSSLNNVNLKTSQYTVNVINDGWENVYEPNGYVFLPCGGYRNGLTFGQNSGSVVSGFYRASTQKTGSDYWRAYYFQFKTGSQDTGVSIADYQKSDGLNVRLVKNI